MVWDVSTDGLIMRQELCPINGHSDDVFSVAFSPKGMLLGSGSHDKTIKVWDVSTGQDKHTLKGHWDKVNSIAFSPDGQTLVNPIRNSEFGIRN